MPNPVEIACPACEGALSQTRKDWIERCGDCGFLASNLKPEINAKGAALDEALRESALSDLRNANFELILDALRAAQLAPGASILDVGCAHGWFLERAQARGYRCVGIEPDRAMADIARRSGLDIRDGFFPDALLAGETFDAIVFNDVLEHIPDIAQVLSSSAEALTSGGRLAVNLPLSTGVIYRTADLLDKFGWHGPFERMWQKGFPSPHISYVHQSNLKKLAIRAGLEEVSRLRLPSVTMAGLWQRLNYDRSLPTAAAGVVYAAVGAIRPVLRYLPADIGLQIFSKPRTDDA